MKKILSLLLAIAVTCTCMLGLAGCAGGDGDETPTDMKLVRGGDLGYYFYGPTGWIIANQGDMAVTYVSSINNTSVSFVEAQMPDGYTETAENAEQTENAEEDAPKVPEYIMNYYAEQVDALNSQLINSDETVETTLNGEKCLFGNADEAYRFVYKFEYNGANRMCMQIYVINDGSFYIFTYSSVEDEYMTGGSYYNYFLTTTDSKNVQDIIDNFRFVDKTESEDAVKEYAKDDEGYLLISDRTLAGFDMYVPDSYKEDYSSAIVSATDADRGINVNVSKVTVNLGFEKYWEARKEELKLLADSTKNDEGELVSSLKIITDEETLSVVEHNGTQRVEVEYSYSMHGTEYHVFSAYVRSSFDDYMYTFTVRGELTDELRAEALKILNKVTF